MPAHYPIRAVARMTGLSLDTPRVEREHAIGTIATLPDAALRRLAPDRAEPAAPTPSTVNLEPLLGSVTHYDLAAIGRGRDTGVRESGATMLVLSATAPRIDADLGKLRRLC